MQELTPMEVRNHEANEKALRAGRQAREERCPEHMGECTHPAEFAHRDGSGTRCTFCGHLDPTSYLI